ncbi:MAG: maleylpyruvate isomerase N-terminal domain-containing protein [Rhodococcus sp. (in: high G+C Gram-positive bacteria)]
MNADEQLSLLVAECDRIAQLSLEDTTTPVPSMPDWTIEKLVRHLTFVHRMATGVLAVPAEAGMSEVLAAVEKPERGPRILDDYRDSAAAMFDAYRAASPAREVTTWTGVATPAFWIRRQLHEITVHRFDVQDALHAVGGAAPDPADATGAADGVAEWAEACLTRIPTGSLGGVAGRTVHLHTDDGTDMELFLDFTGDAVAVSREHRKGDVALRGSAEDLLLTVWRRRPLGTVEIVGDAAVAEALYESARL